MSSYYTYYRDYTDTETWGQVLIIIILNCNIINYIFNNNKIRRNKKNISMYKKVKY